MELQVYKMQSWAMYVLQRLAVNHILLARM